MVDDSKVLNMRTGKGRGEGIFKIPKYGFTRAAFLKKKK